MEEKWRTALLRVIKGASGHHYGRRILSVAIFGAALLVTPFSPASADERLAWKVLRSGGHIAIMRHAIAPGNGDPADFSLGDCATQRNLSEGGRVQAARIGARFRKNGIRAAHVFSSQWCRCKDTAELLGLGPTKELPALNSFYGNPQNRGPQMELLGTWLKWRDFRMTHVLVTHQVNITALTGVYPNSGEIVVVRPSASGSVKVIGTIKTD